MLSDFRCHACRQPTLAYGFSKRQYRYLVCASCGSASLQSGWADATYGESYFALGTDHGYFDYESDRRLHTETAQRRLEATREVARETTTVVDVGAALGFTLEVARAEGWNAIGVEISEYAASRLRESGFEVHRSLEDLDAGSCDAVLFGQVLEHIPDPNAAVVQAHRILRPGGAIFIETWDRLSATAERFGKRWQQIAPPSVVHLFTTQGIEEILKRNGFGEITVRPWRKRVSVTGYLGVLASRLPHPVGRTLIRIARATRISRIALTYKFDDLIAVTARKPG